MFWKLKRLMPARSQAAPHEYDVVLDLDQIIATPKAFTFQGRDYVIKPIEVQEFMKSTQALAHLDWLKVQKSITEEQIITAYMDLFSVLIDKFHRKDFERMSMAQVAALFSFVLKCISGEAFKDLTPEQVEEKKKMLSLISKVKQSELSTVSASEQPI